MSMTNLENVNYCTRVTKFAGRISWHVPEVIYRILQLGLRFGTVGVRVKVETDINEYR
jgi:hypothetical protein